MPTGPNPLFVLIILVVIAVVVAYLYSKRRK
jgi:LPXTG-motif cell wall-anchored protein